MYRDERHISFHLFTLLYYNLVLMYVNLHHVWYVDINKESVEDNDYATRVHNVHTRILQNTVINRDTLVK